MPRRRGRWAASRRWPAAGERGLSLLEATVAVAVIATGIVALTGLAIRTTDTVTRARHRTVGSTLADSVLTELAATAVPATSPGCLLSDVTGCVSYRDADGAERPAALAPYAVRWHAAPVPSSPIPATLLTVCAVSTLERAAATRAPGACVARIVMEAWP